MRRSPALSLLPVLLCALLCTGCQSTPEDAVPYSEDAIYAFLEDAVLSGEPSVTGYFTGNGTAPSSDALDALLHEAIDQSGILYYYVSEYRWANRPAGPSCIRLTVKIHLRQHRRPYNGTAGSRQPTGRSTYCSASVERRHFLYCAAARRRQMERSGCGAIGALRH